MELLLNPGTGIGKIEATSNESLKLLKNTVYKVILPLIIFYYYILYNVIFL